MNSKSDHPKQTDGSIESTTDTEQSCANENDTGKSDLAGARHKPLNPDDNESDVINKLETENADLRDQLLRALAEVENTRRRAQKDLDDTRQFAITKFAGDMLSVADNLERALGNIPEDTKIQTGPFKTLVDGIELTENEMLRVLQKYGIRKLSVIGERFDPNFHEVLFEAPDLSMPPGTVSKVVESGYTIGTRPLRAAKVGVVSHAKPSSAG